MLRKMMKRALPNSIPDLFMLPVCFIFAGLLILILNGCAPPDESGSENDNLAGHITQGEEETAMIDENGFAEISRPPIDLELPDGLKTVTLGMG